ncbi:MAG: 3'-5' exonuclease [Deltaproteobacteria bacterium]|jgi:DNA polymerase-3 subunit epsilon|nr:3'-5' exonuclease [Deltaproteobacteria bacterium]MBW2534200.1 3'-5' exonuclease [Deltaproteobacteria bacterium]
MKLLESCGCFPTGRHYPGIAHLIRVRAAGLADDFPPDEPWRNYPIAFVDTETTGRDPKEDRVIEVGIVIGEGGELKSFHSWLINPGMPIPAESTKIHGITDEEVAGKPTFAEAAAEILEVLAGALPAAYNAEFDRGFILAEVERAQLELESPPPAVRPNVRWLDPLVFAREVFPGRQSRALGAVCKRLGIELERAHRATDDAAAALRVLYAIAEDPKVPDTYAAFIREQSRLETAQEEARRFWRK